MLKKIEVTMTQVTSRLRKTTDKHRIEVSKSLNNVAKIDSRNKSTFWRDIIAKEMKITGVASCMIETRQAAPVGHTRTGSHAMFVVKKNLSPKNRWVLDGYTTPAPEGSVNAGVVFEKVLE